MYNIEKLLTSWCLSSILKDLGSVSSPKHKLNCACKLIAVIISCTISISNFM